MEPSIACAKAGVTTGEWAARPARGVRRIPRADRRCRPPRRARGRARRGARPCRGGVGNRLGRRLKLLVGKPGLDGHSNGAEQIAVRARDCGMEVVYEGIRLTPAQIVARRRWRKACTWSACRSCRARMCRWRTDVSPAARGWVGRHAAWSRRHHPGGGREGPERRRRRARLSRPRITT